MNFKRLFILFLIAMPLLLGLTSKIFANDINISMSPSLEIQQGQTAFIKVNTHKNLLNPYIIFENKKIPLFKQKNNTYRAIIGFNASSSTGDQQILLKDESGYLNRTCCFKVKAKKFPIQNIKISGSKSKLNASKYELQKVNNAKQLLSGNLMWNEPPFNSPTKGCIISKYGLKRYHNGKYTGSFHKGIDIKAPNGQDIYSITNGKVIIAEQFNLHGGTVAIEHGQGLMSIYIHMSKINVKPNQYIKQGDKIGEVGSTGFATGPHLHWGLYINGIAVDPSEYWIKKVPEC